MLFLLKTLGGGVKARVMINGIQAFRMVPGPTKSSKTELNASIVEGTNDVSLYLGPAKDFTKDANLDIKIVRSDGGKETKLAAWRFDAGKTKLQPQVPAKVWREEFKVDKAFGRWSWEDAPKDPPKDKDQQAIVTVVAELHKALAAKDAKATINLLDTKIEELSRAHGVAAAQMRDDQKSFLDSVFGAADWSVEPFQAGGLTLVPAADGRLLAVTDPVGKPPIKATAGKQPILFQLTVSRIGKDWRIVR